jgi:HEAT repeat protein
MLGHVRLNSSRTGLLAFIGLPAVATPMFSQTHQSGIGKQKNLPRHSIQERVRRDLGEASEDEDAVRELFALGDEAVPSLIKFLSDTGNDRRAGAARGLAYIGNQQGMQALRNAVRTERDKETKSTMSCFLAGGLVETKSESDLDFLRSTVERVQFVADDDETAFSAVCAALALGMRGGSDSLAVLRKVAKVDVIGVEEIGKAIQWMESKSAPRQAPAGQSLSEEELIKKMVLDGTFFAQVERSRTSVEELTFNRQRNKALVSLEIYLGPKSARGYDLVLAKESDVWRVVGIWFAWVA